MERLSLLMIIVVITLLYGTHTSSTANSESPFKSSSFFQASFVFAHLSAVACVFLSVLGGRAVSSAAQA